MDDVVAPAAPEPDTQDWTWVVDRPCGECGFDAASVAAEEIGGRTRLAAAEVAAAVTDDPERARRRPQPVVWSPLEYACHVRDVCRLYAFRLALMLEEDGPSYPNWDQDATAIAERYDLQDPSEVAVELVAAAGDLADAFEEVEGAQWQRTGLRSDGAAFTVDRFARYLLHDLEHHVHDVRSGLAPA